MKTTTYILIGGGAVALFLLWQRNKNKNVISTTAEATAPSTSTATTPVNNFAPNPVKQVGGAPLNNVAPQTPTFPAPSTNQPEQVYGLNLPASMDLPVLTAGTGVPTEVAVQQGGVVTTPTPAIAPTPPLTTQESLTLSGVRPSKILTTSLSTNIQELS